MADRPINGTKGSQMSTQVDDAAVPDRAAEAGTPSHDTGEPQAPRSSATIVFLGMLRPMTYMRVTESSPSGVGHFYRAFSLYCLLPMVLLNISAIIGQQVSPEVWRFHDINPWTVLVGSTAQLIVGPLLIWTFAYCMAIGMALSGLDVDLHKHQYLTTGWYTGTTMLCLGHWWLGIGVAFASVRSWSDTVDAALTIALVAGLAVLLWTAGGAYLVNAPKHGGATAVRSIAGLVLGGAAFIIAWTIIGVLFQTVVLSLVFAIG